MLCAFHCPSATISLHQTIFNWKNGTVLYLMFLPNCLGGKLFNLGWLGRKSKSKHSTKSVQHACIASASSSDSLLRFCSGSSSLLSCLTIIFANCHWTGRGQNCAWTTLGAMARWQIFLNRRLLQRHFKSCHALTIPCTLHTQHTCTQTARFHMALRNGLWTTSYLSWCLNDLESPSNDFSTWGYIYKSICWPLRTTCYTLQSMPLYMWEVHSLQHVYFLMCVAITPMKIRN